MSRFRSPAHRRYVQRIAACTLAYLITLTLAVKLIGSGTAGPLAWLLALLPGLSVAAMFWAIGRLIVEETDEYQRLLLVIQTLVATGLTLSLVTIWGFLENFGLVHHIDAFFVAVLWFFGLGVGAVFNHFAARDRSDAA